MELLVYELKEEEALYLLKIGRHPFEIEKLDRWLKRRKEVKG